MKFITDADPYIIGDSEKWKNWQSIYKEPRTCKPCEDKHGKIYTFDSRSYIPEHLRCRCKIAPMRTKQVGTVTAEGWNGADAWLMYKGRLPDNYITKKEALKLGWKSYKRNLNEVCPGKVIGGISYSNVEEKLPEKLNREWHEADFDYSDESRGSNRIFYSNDGLIFVSCDHGQTFYELVK